MAALTSSPAPQAGIPTVPAFLVCGFLGAGKTTFLLRRLQEAGSGTAVLVNEFGELGLDGAVISRRAGVDVVEMPGGCVCCSQREGLIASVERIVRELQPKRLFLEPSGVAELSAMIASLADDRLTGLIHLEAAVTMVDATTFLEYSDPDAFGTFFQDQVVHADLVVVNKMDLVDAQELKAVVERVLSLNADAVVVAAEHGRLAETPILSRASRSAKSDKVESPLFERVELLLRRNTAKERIQAFRDNLEQGRYGRVIRAKGCLHLKEEGWIEIHYSGRRFDIREGFTSAQPHLTVIGLDLNGDSLRSDMGVLSPLTLAGSALQEEGKQI